MVDRKQTPNIVKVGGPLFERLAFEHLEKKYDISKEELLQLVKDKRDKCNTLPLSILRHPKISSLESIVKFMRENRKSSYNSIGELLGRNPKTLAVTYNVAHHKMPEAFNASVDDDIHRIPFTAFIQGLSILECICFYLKSQGYSYAKIARMIAKDQRTVWTVCKRAERKSGKRPEGKIDGV